MEPKIGIVGYGYVGKALASLFNNAVIYDIEPEFSVNKDKVNKCDIAFVCVPTPCNKDGFCDISAVEEAVSWLETPIIVIKSTVPPGTTESLRNKFMKNILFSPEHIGETPFHPYKNMRNINFIILGGPKKEASQVAQIYAHSLGPTIRCYFTDSTTAELSKYMANCFFATKVIFCNEFFKIAEAIGVNYEELREVWLADPRISRDHTMVFQDKPGFEGKCLPKDISALIHFSKSISVDVNLLKKVFEVNQVKRKSSVK